MGSEVVVEQFTRQAASFARLSDHEEATQLLLDLAGVGAASAVLDVACGPGLVACAAARRARQVTGIDLTPAMIGEAQALQAKLGPPNVNWQIGQATALPFADASFDAVLATAFITIPIPTWRSPKCGASLGRGRGSRSPTWSCRN